MISQYKKMLTVTRCIWSRKSMKTGAGVETNSIGSATMQVGRVHTLSKQNGPFFSTKL
jgi:hypothetical protein